jgi:predicted nuclease with TOPRIM domain
MTDNYWRAQVPRLEAENAAMTRAALRLQEELERLEAENAKLRAELANLSADYYRMAVQVNGLANHAQEVANE